MARQKAFPVVGIRIPAAEVNDFPKRSNTVCIRMDPSLFEALHELANGVCMKISTYCMRVLYSHVGEQRLCRNHCKRGMA